MKKKYDDLTISEAEQLIKCRDENGELLCRKGCRMHFQMPFGGCCAKNMFLGLLFDICKENGLLSAGYDGYEIDIDLGGIQT